jgi:ATP cone domain
MYVIKRNGVQQPVHFDKITARIVKLCYGLNPDFVDPVYVAQKVTGGAKRLQVAHHVHWRGELAAGCPGSEETCTGRNQGHGSNDFARTLLSSVSIRQPLLIEHGCSWMCRCVQGGKDLGAG